MNLNNSFRVLMCCTFLVLLFWGGCEKKLDFPQISLKEKKVIPISNDTLTLAELYPSIFPEEVFIDSITANSFKTYANNLLQRIGLELDDVHLGIYLGQNEYVCFYNGKHASFVLILGTPELLNTDFIDGYLPSTSYIEYNQGPNGMPLLVLPHYTTTLLSDIKFIHEYCHIGQMQDNLARIVGEYEAVYESFNYFKYTYPNYFSQLIKRTQPKFKEGKYSRSIYVSCAKLAREITPDRIEQWFLMQEFMSFLAIDYLERTNQLNADTFTQLFEASQACIERAQQLEVHL